MLDSMKETKSRGKGDPGRRDRIITAAMDAIAELGVSGTSLRQIAATADVPLGSVTYYFTSRDELLLEAFRLFTQEITAFLEARLSAAKTRVEIRAVIVDHICGEGWATRKNLLLSYELYAFSSRTEESKEVLRTWLERVREALMRHFDKCTADALDALIEGYSIHRSVDKNPATRTEVTTIVDRILQY